MKKGWEIKKLWECFKLKSGDMLSAKMMKEGNISVYGGNGISGYHNVSNLQGENIIIGRVGALCGNVRLVSEKIWLTDNAFLITEYKFDFDKSFLTYLLNFKNLRSYARQAAQPVISNSSLNEVEISFPKSITEQQRIVSILDKCFSAIDKAKANAEQNLKNTKELFESYLQGVFENGNWEKIKLSDITSDITDGDHLPPPKSENGLNFITISDINKTTHKIDFSDTFKVPKHYYDNLKPNRKPMKGDVLYTVTGSYGIPVLIEDNFAFCFQRHIGLIRPSNKLNSKLLFYWILSPQAISQANETATGTAQKTVSLKSLRNFDFPNIPFKEQEIIVHQLDILRAETQKLETVYKKKIANLDELKKGILQKAFNKGDVK